MRETAEELKRDHEKIEEDLNELEIAYSSEEINYANLVHTFKKIISIWNPHEIKEEAFFKELKSKNFGIPYKKIVFDHGLLGKYKDEIVKAFNSGSENKIKSIMDTKGRDMINMLREHMKIENEILYTLPFEMIEVS